MSNNEAYFDQLDAARKEAQAVWPFNWHLIEDEYFMEATRRAVNGRPWHSLYAALGSSPRVRYVSGTDTEWGARPVAGARFDERVRDVIYECDRCAFYDRVSIGMEAEFQSLGIRCDTSVVLFWLCADCQTELNGDYSDVHWGVRHGATV